MPLGEVVHLLPHEQIPAVPALRQRVPELVMNIHIRPYDLAFDSQRNIYMCDYGNNQVQVLDPDGGLQLVMRVGQPT